MAYGDEFDASLALATRELGHHNFHQRLLELAGTILNHDMGWIVRYDGELPPEVLYTKGIPQNIVDYYLGAQPQLGDPYFCSWRTNVNARIETLADALPMAVDRAFYDQDFMRRAEFTDELALYLPSFGSACLSLFFELRDRRFGPAELQRLQALFPAVLGLHDAHLRIVLAELTATCSDCKNNSFVVLDRAGAPIFSTIGWRQAVQDTPKIAAVAQCKLSCACDHCELDDIGVRKHSLGNSNTLAPGGSLIYLSSDPATSPKCNEQRAIEIVEKLTPRERDILLLTLEGHSTGVIAQRLTLAKGYIKNCRLRMYKKFNVSSERKMISLLTPIVEPVMSRIHQSSRSE
jgi:DNA-binding CsgD family transcriptional regulator